MENEGHKRRVHYSGRYPKNFHEKYKELQPELYGDTVEHVRAKGNTPAGTHIPIMVQEILDILGVKLIPPQEITLSDNVFNKEVSNHDL